MFSINLDKATGRAATADTEFSRQVDLAVAEVSKALLGKNHQIRLALCCLFSG
jgi:hypothetical protein